MSLNILIVDDSSVMRAMIRRCLELSHLPLGEVYEACDGREGLEVLARSWVDILLVDINMPVMNGEEMVQRVREDPALAALPVIVISTEGSRTRIERLESRGVTFVRKPFRPETIREVVLQVVGGPVQCGLDATLARVSQRAIGDLAYLVPLEGPGEPSETAGPVCRASVDFVGPMRGTLMVTMDRPVAIALAANMLALEECAVPTEDQQRDAVCEVASVVCGNLLPTLGGSTAVFDVQPPAFEDVIRSMPPIPSGAATALLSLEAGNIDLVLTVEQEAARTNLSRAGEQTPSAGTG